MPIDEPTQVIEELRETDPIFAEKVDHALTEHLDPFIESLKTCGFYDDVFSSHVVSNILCFAFTQQLARHCVNCNMSEEQEAEYVGATMQAFVQNLSLQFTLARERRVEFLAEEAKGATKQ